MIRRDPARSIQFERLAATDMFLKRYVYRMADKEMMNREQKGDPDIEFWNGSVLFHVYLHLSEPQKILSPALLEYDRPLTTK